METPGTVLSALDSTAARLTASTPTPACVTGERGRVAVPSSWPPPCCIPPSPATPVAATHLGWQWRAATCAEGLVQWEVPSGSEPSGRTATYISFCSGYFGTWYSPLPPAPSPSGVGYSPAMVLGVCITFALPGPLEPGLLITLGP